MNYDTLLFITIIIVILIIMYKNSDRVISFITNKQNINNESPHLCKLPNVSNLNNLNNLNNSNKELLLYAENETNALIKNIAILNANSYAEKEKQLTSYANNLATEANLLNESKAKLANELNLLNELRAGLCNVPLTPNVPLAPPTSLPIPIIKPTPTKWTQ